MCVFVCVCVCVCACVHAYVRVCVCVCVCVVLSDRLNCIRNLLKAYFTVDIYFAFRAFIFLLHLEF